MLLNPLSGPSARHCDHLHVYKPIVYISILRFREKMGTTLIYRRNLQLKEASDLFAINFIILFCFLRLGGTVEKDLILCVQIFSVVS